MIQEAIQGAIAGAAATGPMTVVMELGHAHLPRDQQYDLPPRQITRRVGKSFGLWQHATKVEKSAATLAAHFAYGSGAGALYGWVVPREHQNVWTGTAYGLSVWTGSYLGLIPALRILRPATQHPAERNTLMIAAHLVWGAVLGVSLQQIAPDVE